MLFNADDQQLDCADIVIALREVCRVVDFEGSESTLLLRM
jgi:hypothetical protein